MTSSFSVATIFQILLVTSTCFLSVYSRGAQCSTKKVITYNTALLDMPLAPKLPNNRLERRDAIIGELNNLKADVVCLQEVWIGEDVETIVKGVSDVYGYSASKLHVNGNLPCQMKAKEPACDFMDLTNFAWCATVHGCLKKKNRFNILLCVAGSCYQPYCKLSQSCLSCLVASFTNQLSAFAKCAANGVAVPGMRRVNEPGLLLLSRTPIWDSTYVDFHPQTKECIERGYLESNVDGLGKIVCTHTTNNLPNYMELDLWMDGVFGTYIEQGNDERAHLINRFGNTSPIILMGDFNVGDTFSLSVIPDLPNEFCNLADSFNVSPLRQCTNCGKDDNPYNAKTTGLVNTVVDHVFYRGHTVLKVERIFTRSDAVMFDGLPLSNHYGVMAIISQCW